MPNPLLLDIVTYLTTNGAIEGDGVDTFRDFIPESPDNIVAITEYTGSPIVPHEPAAHRSVQVSVRNLSADAARVKANEIFKLFRSENSIIVFTPERWGQVSLRQPPFRMKTDNADRVTYGFNMGITTSLD